MNGAESSAGKEARCLSGKRWAVEGSEMESELGSEIVYGRGGCRLIWTIDHTRGSGVLVGTGSGVLHSAAIELGLSTVL